MKILSKPIRTPLKTDLLVLAVSEGKLQSSFAKQIDKRLNGFITQIIKKENFQGKSGDARLLDVSSGPVRSILLVGFGEGNKQDAETLRKMAARGIRYGKKLKVGKVTLEDVSLVGIAALQRGQAFAEGVLLGDYHFTVYKTDSESKKKPTVLEVEILSNETAPLNQGIRRGTIFAESTNLARDLVNTPASDMTPKHVADEAKKLSKLPHVSVKVYDKKAIEKMGMGCYLAVSYGSTQPPYFIHVTYRPPTRPRKRMVIVGKGITFDSGGLSLKTAQSMETMKDDMSGAAAMLGVMKALSTLKPPVEVHGISAVTENMPSGSAEKPGDIARSMNGKTVEILNTDAEGRLTLADALTYALKLKPDLVIDAATLTGACVVALGELCSGIMGNDEKLIQKLTDCGKVAGEKIWPLPLIEEYKQDLKSSIADLKNIGGRWAGTINAGLFLQEFVDPKIPWAHVDIAGPSWTEKELDYCPRGGTGHLVRTLLHFILES